MNRTIHLVPVGLSLLDNIRDQAGPDGDLERWLDTLFPRRDRNEAVDLDSAAARSTTATSTPWQTARCSWRSN